jgi:uncharacterized protein (TIRG00374 family)
MKKRLLSLFQLAIGIGLIALLFYRMDNKSDLLNALHDITGNGLYLAGAIISFLVCMIMCAWRWKLILAAHNMNISMLRAMNLYFIGQFFNAFMPGSVGGDIVKAVIVAKEFPGKKTIAVTTIFIDRLIGLLSLVLLASAITVVRYKFFMRYPETRMIMLLMIGVAGAAVSLIFIMFHHNILEKGRIATFLNKHKRIGSIINRVYNAFQDCLTHRGLMTRTMLVSLGNHIAIIAAAFLLGLGLNINTTTETAGKEPAGINIKAEFANYLTIFPIINGIAAIPVTPGGLGTREYATKLMMGLPEFNVPATRAITLSLLLYLTTMFWSLVGGLVYAVYVIRNGIKKSPAAAVDQG